MDSDKKLASGTLLLGNTCVCINSVIQHFGSLGKGKGHVEEDGRLKSGVALLNFYSLIFAVSCGYPLYPTTRMPISSDLKTVTKKLDSNISGTKRASKMTGFVRVFSSSYFCTCHTA